MTQKHTPGPQAAEDRFGSCVVWPGGFRSAMPNLRTARLTASAENLLRTLRAMVENSLDENSICRYCDNSIDSEGDGEDHKGSPVFCPVPTAIAAIQKATDTT